MGAVFSLSTWTDITREEHNRNCNRYPSDCCDEDTYTISSVTHSQPNGSNADKLTNNFLLDIHSAT